MIRQYLMPALAVCGVVFAGFTVLRSHRPVPIAEPIAQPAASAFAALLAGAGIIEPSSEIIAIGAPMGALVTAVPVAPGAQVKAGDVLFQLDDRTQRAQLVVQQAAVAAAKAQLARLVASPRAEDLPIAEAQLAEMRVALVDAKRQQVLVEGLVDKRAVSTDDVERRRAATQVAEARVRQGEAELAKLKAGAWAPDLAVAQAQLAQAEAVMRATEVDIARLAVTAPVAATVLQVKIRPGEFAAAGGLAQPHVQLGATGTLHVRVDIDENDAWRFKPGAAGECFVRGNLHLHAKLRFVRVEPYVVPKRSLTGDAVERVDTRVLQVLYAFDPKELTAYVGQQVDVYIETATLPPVPAPVPAPVSAPVPVTGPVTGQRP